MRQRVHRRPCRRRRNRYRIRFFRSVSCGMKKRGRDEEAEKGNDDDGDSESDRNGEGIQKRLRRLAPSHTSSFCDKYVFQLFILMV